LTYSLPLYHKKMGRVQNYNLTTNRRTKIVCKHFLGIFFLKTRWSMPDKTKQHITKCGFETPTSLTLIFSGPKIWIIRLVISRSVRIIGGWTSLWIGGCGTCTHSNDQAGGRWMSKVYWGILRVKYCIYDIIFWQT
jgi:hypothetical protein